MFKDTKLSVLLCLYSHSSRFNPIYRGLVETSTSSIESRVRLSIEMRSWDSHISEGSFPVNLRLSG